MHSAFTKERIIWSFLAYISYAFLQLTANSHIVQAGLVRENSLFGRLLNLPRALGTYLDRHLIRNPRNPVDLPAILTLLEGIMGRQQSAYYSVVPGTHFRNTPERLSSQGQEFVGRIHTILGEYVDCKLSNSGCFSSRVLAWTVQEQQKELKYRLFFLREAREIHSRVPLPTTLKWNNFF